MPDAAPPTLEPPPSPNSPSDQVPAGAAALPAAPSAPRRPTQSHAHGKKLVMRAADRREKVFAKYVVQGWPVWRAYQVVSGCEKKESCERNGFRWRVRPAVEGEIIRLRAALNEAEAMTRVEKRTLLGGIARDAEQPGAVRISAIAVDNRMTGDDEPLKVVVGGEVVFTVNPFAGSAGARVVDAVRAAATVAGAQVALEAGSGAIEADAK